MDRMGRQGPHLLEASSSCQSPSFVTEPTNGVIPSGARNLGARWNAVGDPSPRQGPLNRMGRMDGMRAGSGQGHPACPAHPVPPLFAVAVGESRQRPFNVIGRMDRRPDGGAGLVEQAMDAQRSLEGTDAVHSTDAGTPVSP